MWDFILLDEESQEALLVATRSKNPVELSQTNMKKKPSIPPPRDKEIGKKSIPKSTQKTPTLLDPSPKSTQTTPTQLDPSPSSKTLIVSDEME